MNNLLQCLKKRKSLHVPIWFMRQAGRYLPEFRDIRKKNSNFLKLCLNKKLIPKITLQPLERYDLDAAIIFSDILIIPYALGQNIRFVKNKGPILNKLNFDKILNINQLEFNKKLLPIYNSITSTRNILNKKKSLISFVAAPWTLLIYMINQKSPKKKLNLDKIFSDKSKINIIMDVLNDFICLHIKNQIKAGSDIVQIFDSWAGLLPNKKLYDYCYLPNLKIVNFVKEKNIPVICFPKGIKKKMKEFNKLVRPDCINIDYDIDPFWARKNLDNTPIQGGLDPKILLKDKKIVSKNVLKYLHAFKNYPYVFNLGHGILPNTNPDIISFIINEVKKNE